MSCEPDEDPPTRDFRGLADQDHECLEPDAPPHRRNFCAYACHRRTASIHEAANARVRRRPSREPREPGGRRHASAGRESPAEGRTRSPSALVLHRMAARPAVPPPALCVHAGTSSRGPSGVFGTEGRPGSSVLSTVQEEEEGADAEGKTRTRTPHPAPPSPTLSPQPRHHRRQVPSPSRCRVPSPSRCRAGRRAADWESARTASGAPWAPPAARWRRGPGGGEGSPAIRAPGCRRARPRGAAAGRRCRRWRGRGRR